MFLNDMDKRYMAIRTAAVSAIKKDITLSEGELGCLYAAAFTPDMDKEVHCIKQTKKFNVMKEVSDSQFIIDFFSGERWFAESLASNNTAAVMWSDETGEYIVIDMYDKEFDFYVVDFLDEELVDITLPIKDIAGSFKRRIVEKYWLADRFNKVMVITG